MENETKIEMKDGVVEAQGTRFCPLCGKNRKNGEFKSIVMGAVYNMEGRIEGCQACQVVFHNARRMWQMMMIKFKQQQIDEAKAKNEIDQAMGKRIAS